MTEDKKILILKGAVVAVILFIVGALAVHRLLNRPTAPTDPAVAALAECLTQKGTKMYGAYWCPHCVNQKKAFGDAVTKIDYIECGIRGNPSGEEQVCKDKDIKGLPTWIFADGTRVEGEQTFKDLAAKSGCPWTQ